MERNDEAVERMRRFEAVIERSVRLTNELEKRTKMPVLQQAKESNRVGSTTNKLPVEVQNIMTECYG